MSDADHIEYEVLIEKRLRGEESQRDRARLDAHLGGCDQCRLVLDEATRTVQTAHDRLRRVREDTDWPTLERHLSSEVAALRSTARIYIGIAVLGPVTTALILVCLGPVLG